MKWVISDDLRVPIKSWCEPLEKSALEQAKNLANLPFTFKHVALMPDWYADWGSTCDEWDCCSKCCGS